MTTNTEGYELRAERERAHVTILALAAEMGAHRSTIWRYEMTAVVDPEIAAEYRAALARLTERTAA